MTETRFIPFNYARTLEKTQKCFYLSFFKFFKECFQREEFCQTLCVREKNNFVDHKLSIDKLIWCYNSIDEDSMC